ncbi:methyltransferase domain-containing protein [Candidatus Woesearchaeota archaeon]|nr:methyltransferase domain-containing protein [Candidatus Woesearchaeota archaeon]
MAWGYIPGLEHGFRELLLRLIGHPHPNGRTRARKVLQLLERRKTLDIGCGEGIFYYELSRRGIDMKGIDYSLEALRNMREKLKAAHAELQVCNANAQKLPFKDGSFEQIICLDVLEHLPDAQAALKEMSRTLRKNGAAIITVPNELYLTKPVLPINFKEHLKAIGHESAGFDYKQLKEMLEKEGFRIVRHEYYLKFFGRVMTELTFWPIGGKRLWKARTKMYKYSYLAFIAFILTYPVMFLDDILPNRNGGMMAVKAVKVK